MDMHQIRAVPPEQPAKGQIPLQRFFQLGPFAAVLIGFDIGDAVPLLKGAPPVTVYHGGDSAFHGLIRHDHTYMQFLSSPGQIPLLLLRQASRSLLLGSLPRQHHPHGLKQDFDIQSQRPVVDVFQIQFHNLVKIHNLASAADLP